MSDRNRLIEEYQDYVRKLARKLMSSLSIPSKLRDELESAGYVGLVEAADRFNPETGIPFTQFSKIRIRGAMIDSIREHSHLTGRAYRMSRALQAMHDVSETAPASNLEGVLEFAAQGALTFQLSLSDAAVEAEAVSDAKFNPLKLLENAQDNKRLRDIVAALPDRERSIVELYYFQGKSFVEIAHEDEELSKSWVSRLHARALHLIRVRLEEIGYGE